jgi:F-type H+-transporting ATPase subunit c
MFKKLAGCCMALLTQGAVAWAAEGGAGAAQQLAQPAYVNYFSVSIIVAGFALAVVAALCGIAQGKAVTSALDGIARQPEATPKIQMVLMIGLAFIESLVLYTLFIGIIILFVNPFTKLLVH